MYKSEYLKKLNKKRIAVGCLIFNNKKDLLILKTTYEDNWTLPGGCVERGESPLEALERELKEEIAIVPKIKRCVVIDYDYKKTKTQEDESLQMIFLAEPLENARRIKVNGTEIVDFKFLCLEECYKRLKSKIVKRIIDFNGEFGRTLFKKKGKTIELDF